MSNKLWFGYFTLLASALVAVSFTGCVQGPSPVNFSVTFPQPNVIGFDANLTQKYGIGLAGSFTLPQSVGTIVLVPETPAQGFGLQLDLNTAAFLKSTWVNFKETTTLPTGAPFPGWLTGTVVDVTSPDLNQNGVDYHFYFGDQTQFYVGVAGVIHAINGSFPAITIGYTFYDATGRVVLGFQFFGPNGAIPGGIFIGSNLTPFIQAAAPSPTPTPTPTPAPVGTAVAARALSISSAELMHAVTQANRGLPATINGQSVVAEIRASGPDAHRYRSQSSLNGVINRFMAASRTTR